MALCAGYPYRGEGATDAVNQEYVEHLRREYEQAVNKVIADNPDLPERLKTANVQSEYDIEDDLLEIVFNERQEATSLSIGDGLWLRLDFETNKIVGFELEHFLQHLESQSRELRLVFSVLRFAGARGFEVRLPRASDEATDPLKAMQELAIA
jgi:uncharacterized protein YuzE